MTWKSFLRPFAIQFVGHAVMGGLAWYWLSLGVATTWLVAANVLLAICMLLGWSFLDAFGLNAPGQWLRAVPAVALMPFIGLHAGFAVLIPFVWMVLLFPSVAAGRWKVLLSPIYIAICSAILLAMTVIPAALLNWIPALEGLNLQLVSFGLRAIFAYAVFVGGWAGLLLYISRTASRDPLLAV